jgi:hypothetical protein
MGRPHRRRLLRLALSPRSLQAEMEDGGGVGGRGRLVVMLWGAPKMGWVGEIIKDIKDSVGGCIYIYS